MKAVNVGDRFYRLVVLGESEKRDKSRSKFYRCKCDCGTIVDVRKGGLFSGRVKSCGCFTKDRVTKHKMSGSRLYHIRTGMIARCCNPKSKDYIRYGARGVTVCDEWLNNPQSFFDWALSNGYKSDLSIDRIDVNKGYSPDNCRWVSAKIQANNTRTNLFITYKGRKQTLKQWCEELELPYGRTKDRLNRGLSIERVFKKKNDFRAKLILYKGKEQSLMDWSRELKICYSTLWCRFNKGWPLERVFETK